MRLTSKLWVLLLVSLVFPFVTVAQTETTISGNLLYAKIMNGLNLVVMPLPAGNTELTLYIKTGSAYESDSLNGIGSVVHNILADKISRRLRTASGPLSLQNTTFQEYATTEHSVYKLTCQAANVNLCLQLLRDSIFLAPITQAEINKAVNAGLKEIENVKYDKKKLFQDKILKSLYKQDHNKLEVSGSANTLKNINYKAVKRFFLLYYVPNNTIAVATGNFTPTTIRDQFEVAFGSLIKSEFNPENVTKLVHFRPMAYTTQFVVEDSSKAPEFTICWQFPGTSANPRGSYCAYLLNAMLNDRFNYIRTKATKMGCKNITVEYEANNFSGMLRFSFQPSLQNFFPTYDFIMTEMRRLDKTFLNETMMNAGKLAFKEEYEGLKKSKQYPEFVALHWEYNDETYFPLLLDSVMKVREYELKDFMVTNLDQCAHVVGLRINKADRDSLKVDRHFTDLDESVAKYVFKYRQNITDLERTEDLVNRDNLLQWLNINSDVNVQVNGFSDEHEYNRASNDTIMQFIDSIPTFKQVKADIVKRGYLRPEMMRSMKLIKFLYDHGIAADRLSGTSMVFKSANKQEAMDNMKCTLTLNKFHKSPSLFEFHYGSKDQ